jgi:hypothetical protein
MSRSSFPRRSGAITVGWSEWHVRLWSGQLVSRLGAASGPGRDHDAASSVPREWCRVVVDARAVRPGPSGEQLDVG